MSESAPTPQPARPAKGGPGGLVASSEAPTDGGGGEGAGEAPSEPVCRGGDVASGEEGNRGPGPAHPPVAAAEAAATAAAASLPAKRLAAGIEGERGEPGEAVG